MGWLDTGKKALGAVTGAIAGAATSGGRLTIPGAIAGWNATDNIGREYNAQQMSAAAQQALQQSRTNALETQRSRQQDLLNAYQGNVRNLQAAIPRGEAAIRANIAQRLSSTMAGVPVGSGAGLASASQSGYDADMASARFGLGAAQQMGQAQTDYATAAYEASLPENRVMTATEQEQELLRQFETEMQKIVDNNTGFWGIDEEEAYKEMLDEAAKEPDPTLRAQMEQKARDWFDLNMWRL